jgi:hypothetical protein
MKITYEIDNKRKSNIVIVGIHGLGMDASMYKRFAKKSPHRVIAPTLMGSSVRDETRQEIGIIEHVEMVKEYLREKLSTVKIRTSMKNRKLVLVGFSMGADIVRQISIDERFNNEIRGIEYILLDPNLNLKTCFLSLKLEQLTKENFETEMLALLSGVKDNKETFRAMMDYLNLIVKKFQLRPEYIAYMAKTMVDLYRANKGKNGFINEVMAAMEDVMEKNHLAMTIYFSKDEESSRWVSAYKKGGGLVLVNKIDGGHFDLVEREFLLRITK